MMSETASQLVLDAAVRLAADGVSIIGLQSENDMESLLNGDDVTGYMVDPFADLHAINHHAHSKAADDA